MSGESPNLSERFFIFFFILLFSLGRWERGVFLGGDDDELWLILNIFLYRAFADFVLGSLILHFFCVNFIN